MLSQQEVGGREPWPWSIWDTDNRWVAHLSVLTCEMGMSQPHPWKQKGGDQEGQEGGPSAACPLADCLSVLASGLHVSGWGLSVPLNPLASRESQALALFHLLEGH